MGSSSKAQTVGFRYSFDIHMGLGQSLDEICAIRASGKTAWSGSISDNGRVRINAPTLFGGDKGEGGLDGTLDVMFGDETQTPVSKLVSMLGGIVPGFRGITTAFYSGLITSVNPYPKSWEVLRRGGNRLWDSEGAWYPAKQFIWLADNQIKAMNPAHILYLIYTGRRFRGLSRSFMDDAAWHAAADTLYAEQLGLCFEWKRSDTFKTFRDNVLAHISAEVYLDRNTGLLSIRLLRDDYDVNSLPLFDENSGLLEITQAEASAGDADSVPSQLVGTFEDAITGDTRKVRAVNSAVAQRDGGRSSEEVDYPGAPTAEIAGRLVARDLRIKTSALKRFKVVLDRRGRALTPGQPFCLRSLKRGIETIVVRAGRIEDGTLTDGRMTITALQDVFSLPAMSYISTPPIGWLPPDRTPQSVSTRRLFELPYREIAGVIDPANLALLDATACYVASLAEAPTSMSMSYNLTDRVGTSGAFVDREAHDWCPTGLVSAAMAKTNASVSVTVTSATRLDDVVIGSAALIDDEILRVDAINYSTGILTLARGCADTVPGTHAAGARIWFYDGFEGVDETLYSQGVTIQAQLLTNTSTGQLAPELAGTDSITLQGRLGRPYPPGQFMIAGAAYPATLTGSFLVTWAHRNRTGQADQLIDTSVGSIGPQSGTSYTVQVRRADTGALLAEQTGLTGTTSNPITLTYPGLVDVQLFSVVGGRASLFMHSHRVTYAIQVQSILLMNMEGAEGSTTFIDAKGHPMTAAGNAHITTTSSPFGTSSAAFDGTADWIETSSVSDFVFGLGPFTAEAWINTSAAKAQAILDFYGGSVGWQVYLDSSGKVVWYQSSSVLSSTSNLVGAGWRHVAFTRDENSVLRCFINGVLEGSVSHATNYSVATPKFAIGAQVFSRNSAYDFNGRIGPVRIVRGKAMYTSAFTPPTGPFPTDS